MSKIQSSRKTQLFVLGALLGLIVCGESMSIYAQLGLVMLIGLAAMYFVRGNAGVMVAGGVMMSGYMMMSAALGANIRDWTPKDKAGHFQGIRMIFAVMLPMIIGPAIGAEVIRNSDSTYVELGVVKTVPTPGIFLAAAVVLLLLVPFVLALRKQEGTSCRS